MKHAIIPARTVLALAVVAVLCTVQPALGQSTAANIIGTVRDSSGKAALSLGRQRSAHDGFRIHAQPQLGRQQLLYQPGRAGEDLPFPLRGFPAARRISPNGLYPSGAQLSGYLDGDSAGKPGRWQTSKVSR